MGGITPQFGIRYPNGTTKANELGAALGLMGDDIERALLAAQVQPVTNQARIVAPSAAARDSYFGVPATEAARLTLQASGAETVRTDTGRTERYYATYNAGTNPQGAPIAGWWPVPGQATAKVLRAASSNITGANQLIQFDTAPIPLAGAWSAGAATRLVLPYPGSWKISGAVTSGGLDTKLLRSWIQLNGAVVADSQDNKMGTAGVTDPFCRPATTVKVTNTTSYLELGISSNGAGTTAPGTPMLLAEYLGANV